MERFSLCHQSGKETEEFQRMAVAHAIMNRLLQQCSEEDAWSAEFQEKVKEAHRAMKKPLDTAEFRKILLRKKDQGSG